MKVEEIEKIEDELNEICEETDFYFDIFQSDESENAITILAYGDNPEGEDWFYEFEYTLPKNNKKIMKKVVEKVYDEFTNYYNAFNIEENVYLMLEAKKNGFTGVPNVVDLVHNEEYKENALCDFLDVLRDATYNY